MMEPPEKNEVATITLKSIPDDLYERLKQRAMAHHRSINSEVIVCLERAVQGDRVDPDSFLPKLEALQKKAKLPPLTEKVLREAKNQGRP